MTNATELVLEVPRPLRDPDSRERLLRRWMAVDPGTFPERIDDKEPVRAPLTPERLSETLATMHPSLLLARRRKPAVHFDILAFDRDSAHVSATISSSSGQGRPHNVAKLARAFAEELGPDYGLVHCLTRRELADVGARGRPDIHQRGPSERSISLIAGHRSQLRFGIATLYWENYFGRPYVDMFGRTRLLGVPAQQAFETRWGVVVRLTEDPPTDDTWLAFREVRDTAIRHLGTDAFWPNALRVPPPFIGG